MLYYSIDFFNSMVDTKLQIPITQMIAKALKDPFALDTAWISFMMLSTLVPTLIHLLLALLSVLLYITKTTKWYANNMLKAKKSESSQIWSAFTLAFPTTLVAMFLFYGVYLLFNNFIKLVT